jgi:hypothetical protein
MEKTFQQEKVTLLGHQKLTLSKEKYIDCIDNLFLKLELAYHYQFYKVFGTDDRLNEGKKLWAISLKSFSPETIIEATENVIGAQSYLPTLTDFIKACSEINSHNGFPSVEEAYIEARKSYAPRSEFSWSHPIVYFAGKKIGWNFLDEKDSRELFSSFKKIFNRLREEILDGKELKIPAPESIKSDNKPMNKTLFESLRKKHNV